MRIKIEAYYMTVKDSEANTNKVAFKLRNWLAQYPKDKWNHTIDKSVPKYTTYYVAKKPNN